MSDLRAAAQQALEALEAMTLHFSFARLGESTLEDSTRRGEAHAAMAALRAALAEPIGCVCGEPSTPNVVHRTDGPCYMAEPVQEPIWACPDSAEHRYHKPGHCEDCGKTLVQVAEPVQEPVAWRAVGGSIWGHKGSEDDTPLYEHPPQRKPLTEKEIKRIDDNTHFHESPEWSLRFARAIEAAYGIKDA